VRPGPAPGGTVGAPEEEGCGLMRDALLLVDVINDFRHEDGDALLASFRHRHPWLVRAIAEAREREIPILYANDNDGVWDGDSRRLVRGAIEGRGGELVEQIAPREGDRFVVKPRYSAFDSTPLDLILESLRIERIQLAGTATEMCVAQTAIDARELGYKVTVLAEACACVDRRLEAVALEYLEAVTGTIVARGETLAP
jgi:nicotinamidase-related amidase